MTTIRRSYTWLFLTWLVMGGAASAEEWLQIKFDSAAPAMCRPAALGTPLGLIGAVPLTDAIFTSPVVSRWPSLYGGRLRHGIRSRCPDIEGACGNSTSRGGPGNCNNVSSPALVGGRLHFGTMAGNYYVLNAADGKVVQEIDLRRADLQCAGRHRGPGRILPRWGPRSMRWIATAKSSGPGTWSRKSLKFDGNRWSGEEWAKARKGRVTWRDHFCCSRDLGVHGKMVVVPAGGRTIFLEDAGNRPELRAIGLIPNHNGNEFAAAFGQSIGPDGEVYVQWHRRDNVGRVEILRLARWQGANQFRPRHPDGDQLARSLEHLFGQRSRQRGLPHEAGSRAGFLQACAGQ